MDLLRRHDPVEAAQRAGDGLLIALEQGVEGADVLGDHAWEGWRLDVETGQWWPDDPVGLVGEEPPDDWEDPDRWLLPRSFGSRAGWEDMRDFIGHVRDDELAGRLERAIHGRGAFRYFKDVLAEREGMLQAWYRFSEERQRGRARQWLALGGSPAGAGGLLRVVDLRAGRGGPRTATSVTAVTVAAVTLE